MPRTMITAEQRDSLTPLTAGLSSTVRELEQRLEDLGLTAHGSDVASALSQLRWATSSLRSAVNDHVPYAAAKHLHVDEEDGTVGYYADLCGVIIGDGDNHEAQEAITAALRAKGITTPGVTWDSESGGCAFYAETAAQAAPVLQLIDAMAAAYASASRDTERF